MRFIRLAILSASLVLLTCVAGDVSSAHAQSPGAAKTGFAVKKPVFGGA